MQWWDEYFLLNILLLPSLLYILLNNPLFPLLVLLSDIYHQILLVYETISFCCTLFKKHFRDTNFKSKSDLGLLHEILRNNQRVLFKHVLRVKNLPRIKLSTLTIKCYLSFLRENYGVSKSNSNTSQFSDVFLVTAVFDTIDKLINVFGSILMA